MVIHESGGYVSRTILMPVADGVKGQDVGSLVSYLRRYAIASVANLATADDDAESDREVRTIPAPKLIQLPKEAPKAPAPKAVAPAPKAEAPISAPGSNSDLAKALDFIVPFGKNKGSRLGDLAKNSLDWYIKEYQPKPYNGKISDKDIALREALDLIRDARDSTEIISTDDVPF